MNRSESILRNSLFFFFARIIDLLSGLGGFILIGRYLEAAGLGRYRFIISLVSIIGLLVNLGIDHIIIRELAKDRSKIARITGAAIKLKFLLLLAAIPFFIAGIFLFRLDTDLILCIIYLFIAQLFLREFFTVVPQAVFLAGERLEYRIVTTVVFQLLRFGGIVVSLLLGYGIKTIFFANIIADIAQAGSAMYILKRRFASPDYTAPGKEMNYLFRQALPWGIAFGFTSAFLYIDTIIVKNLCGDEATGIFAAAYQFIVMLIQLIVPMTWVLLPHLSKTFKEKREDYLREGTFYLKGIAVVLLPACLFLGFYAEWILKITMGGMFISAAAAMIIVTPTLFLRGLGYFFDMTFTAWEKQKMVAVVAGTAFFSKFILELLLVPRYGISGAAYGTLIAEIITFVVSYLLAVRHSVRFDILVFAGKPIAAGIITAFALWLLKMPPVAGIVVCPVIFFAFNFVFGTFDKIEREIIFTLIRRKLMVRRI